MLSKKKTRSSLVGLKPSILILRVTWLNGELFYTLREAQVLIERWRVFYNTERPHSSLGYRPPAPETLLPNEELPNQRIAA